MDNSNYGAQNFPQKDNLAALVLDAVSHPVVMVASDGLICYANNDAEQFLKTSASTLAKSRLAQFLPFGSPLLTLVDQVRQTKIPITEYRVDISSPKLGRDKLVDVFVHPVFEPQGAVVILFQEKSRAEKLDKQMTHRGAARSVTSLASMLAHEIKNPLSGIRGAAQLLEAVVGDEDRSLARLIQDETDRIVALVDRMEVFSDDRPIERFPVNIHLVLSHVKAIAKSGFARNIQIVEHYDPSLPPVFANRDQLIQIFLNLVKNAAEALQGREDGVITLSTAYRTGIRLKVQGHKIALPMEFCVEDNGSGVSEDIMPHLFDPFITSKVNGSGLGLALVAKVVNDHGGVIECDSEVGRTVFRILMPMWRPQDAQIQDVEVEDAQGVKLEVGI
ncbi:two-component system sensor histidine kinase NtrB [Bartonella sp. HY406]|uniref:two-component system sensor histidine kinase NtrB n=1 Tax=Bartonella sp. HY406 TaxID=2979331 RepID=UPI0021CA4925|nr:nitrogen regulation protein NR(II) [Bartonella sp. HY406]UXN04172.1 nitrogen regulation protein NR(II) [Bartonella sp. HY406]